MIRPDRSIDPRLARTLWQWLALGTVALCLWPAARGTAGLLGWGPYWAVVAPAIALAVAYRHRLFAPRVEEPATAHRRRPRTVRGQAQRSPGPRRLRTMRAA